MEVVRKIEASNELREIEDSTARKNSSNALASANTAKSNSTTAINVANSAKDTANTALVNVDNLTAVINSIQSDITAMKKELQETYDIASGAVELAERKAFKVRSIKVLDNQFVDGKYKLTETDKDNLFGENYTVPNNGGVFLLFTTVDVLDPAEKTNYVELVEYYNGKFGQDNLYMGYPNYSFQGKNIIINKNPSIETNYRLYAIQANPDLGWL